MTEQGYPPEPWHLRAQLHLSLWRVPLAELPDPGRLPAGVRPVRVGGSVLVGTAWVVYERGGVLEYRELLASLLVRDGSVPLTTVTRIWVDSVASRDGGRRLWGIPKELASFELGRARVNHRRILTFAASSDDDKAIARSVVRPRRPLPGRWPFRFALVQDLDGRPLRSPVRGRARIGAASALWRPEPGGPLGFLAGRRPLLSVSLTDIDMLFGRSPE